MTTETQTPSTDEFVGRLFDASLKALELASMYVGDHLGLYQTLSRSGSVTAGDLAASTNLNQRYLREWLEQQAAAGVLQVDDVGKPAEERRFTLPPEYAAALIDPESPNSIAPLMRAAVAIARQTEPVAEAFRTGGGVSWQSYGEEAVVAQGDFNRPWLLGQLGSEYLPAIPEVHSRLRAAPAARVLDVACGVGWSSIAIARAYPAVTVHGIDVDPLSIEKAALLAAEQAVADRVTFEAVNGSTPMSPETYDFAIIVEAVHDMSNPVGVLSSVRNALKPGASLLVIDERTAETFSAPADDVERLLYAASVLVCLPTGMSETPSAATGTVMRPATLKQYATEAGFENFRILEIDHPFFRFYELR